MISPTSKYIPIEIKLLPYQVEGLKKTIEEKTKELKKCRRGDWGLSLWLMEELEYLRKMLDYQDEPVTKASGKTKV